MFKDKLINEKLWNDYLNTKLSKDFINKKEKEELKDFILNKKYKDIVDKIYNNKYKFSTPIKHSINKNYKTKKRIVYTYTYEEMNVLKFISFLLYDYDYLFSKNLYSFRKTIGVKNAVKSLMVTKNIKNMYGYKVDIKNYFNSINKDILLNNLKKDIVDKDLFNLLSQLLNNEYTIYNNELIKENKGAIAGAPISAFLANYYLKEMDEYFWKQNVFYIRYADDIIIFTKEKEEIYKYKDILYDFLDKYKLLPNKKKEYFYSKGESFEFLGFSFKNNIVDLSKNTINKIKGKIRRTSRGLRRWMIKKNADTIGVIKAMNRKYNRKFYGNDNTELSWKYWFFGTINTSISLKIVDKYYQEQIRYLVTGKHNKKNYKKVPYAILKKCNYKPLVNEYYKFKKVI